MNHNVITHRPAITPLLAAALTVAAMTVAGCDGGAARPAETSHDAETTPSATGDPDRVSIPATVRQNLGIAFAEVQRRPVRRTLRTPGQFELTPESHRAYHAMIDGRVELLVRQFDRVETGDVLLRIESPQWRNAQHEAAEAQGHIPVAEAALRVAEASRREVEQQIELLNKRIAALDAVNVRKIELETQVAELTNKLPRLAAEVDARKVDLHEAHEHYESRLKRLAAITGMSVERLQRPAERDTTMRDDGGPRPLWRTIDRLTITADAPGIVDEVAVSQGTWVQSGGRLLRTTDPALIRFHAHAPQAEIARLRTGLPGEVVPPRGGTLDLSDAITGDIRVGFRAHPDDRVIPVYLTPAELRDWARPGVTAYLDVFVDGETDAQLVIPQTAIVQDGLDLIFFRRDPDDPDTAIRVVADLGVSDGQWVEVKSGVKAGDQIVTEGAYALKLAVSDRPQAPEGYHYHADGSLHKDH